MSPPCPFFREQALLIPPGQWPHCTPGSCSQYPSLQAPPVLHPGQLPFPRPLLGALKEFFCLPVSLQCSRTSSSTSEGQGTTQDTEGATLRGRGQSKDCSWHPQAHPTCCSFLGCKTLQIPFHPMPRVASPSLALQDPWQRCCHVGVAGTHFLSQRLDQGLPLPAWPSCPGAPARCREGQDWAAR